jgi:flagellar L-ring protein precursor FlgH
MKMLTSICLMLLCTLPTVARDKDKKHLTPLSEYLAQYGPTSESAASPSGSLWNPANPFPLMASDYRAQHVNDLLIIRIAEQTIAQSSADLSAQRKLQTTSSIPAIGGEVFNPLNPLLALSSDHQLTGKGQANTLTKLQTSLAGRVAAVLPNGVLVVEAERRVHMNNETQTIVLRGMVRPGDVLADNSVLSTALANLEIELKGKGVVSDAARPSNRIIRALLWLTGF